MTVNENQLDALWQRVSGLIDLQPYRESRSR